MSYLLRLDSLSGGMGSIGRGFEMRVAVLRAGKTFARDYFEQFIFPDGHRTETCEFIQNPREGTFDGAIVVQSMTPLDDVYSLNCPPTRTLCAVVEPPDILTLPDEYTRQFYAVVGPDKRVKCEKRILSAAGHHWFVELTKTEALGAPIADKPRLISAVVSAKRDTPGHRSRFALMQRLAEHFGSRLDWFGRGVRETGTNKLVALASYKYHIVLENGQWPHYWTEKLSDAYVANCFPFYWGAKNAAEYFNPKSFASIDPARPDVTIRTMEAAIDAGLWEDRQAELAQARRQVVTDYHPYSVWQSILEQLPHSAPRPISIKPFTSCQFSAKQRLRFAIRNAVSRS